MTVLNYRISKVVGERHDKKVKSVEVNANSTIISIKKMNDKRVGDYLLVNFRYDVEYGPGVGLIQMVGSLWYTNPKLNTVYSEEKDRIELKKDAMVELSNAIIQESIIEAIALSKRLGLPVPLQLPTVNVKQDKIRFPKAS
ncbi:MAG: hypothetical protein ABIH11_03265 [Candidatus Altiarchaeota archaeon]